MSKKLKISLFYILFNHTKQLKMNLLNTLIKNLDYNLKNILNLLKPVTFADYFVNILNNNGYHAIKYLQNIVLVLSRDINYWFEIELYESIISINFYSGDKYINIYNWTDYNYTHFCGRSLLLAHQKLKKIGNESILRLRSIENEWNELLCYFKNHNFSTNTKHKRKYILSVINSLKNTYILELNLYFNKNLISIIISYLLVIY